MARPFLSAVRVEGPETRRSDLDSLEYAVWTAARDNPALWEAGATTYFQKLLRHTTKAANANGLLPRFFLGGA